MIDFIESEETREQISSPAIIKVLGVGGAGGNTVNSIIESGYQDIDFIVTNTDAQALDLSLAEHKIQIGVKSTKGLGTGANPEVGKRAAEEDIDKIMSQVEDADIVFLTAGMGGGTGSGAVPVIAQALHEKGILSIAVVTKPFLFEGKRRTVVANESLERLKQVVDTLIVIPNQKLLEVTDKNVSMIDAFSMINDVLSQSVRSVSDIVTKPGHINVDFADVRAIMKDRGLAVMGTGCASGDERASEATLKAISSPLLENMSVTGARGILFNITGGTNLGLHEISEAASVIYEEAHEDANIIFGSVIDENLTDEVIVTIIATGFDQKEDKKDMIEKKKEQPQPQQQLDQAMLSVQAMQMARDLVQALKEEKTVQSEKMSSEKKIDSPSDANTSQIHVVDVDNTLNTSIDVNDLDIPAFMRQKAQKESE